MQGNPIGLAYPGSVDEGTIKAFVQDPNPLDRLFGRKRQLDDDLGGPLQRPE
jgi:hypothetical protein